MERIAMFGALAAMAVTLAETKAQAVQVQDDVVLVGDGMQVGDAPVLVQAMKDVTLHEVTAPELEAKVAAAGGEAVCEVHATVPTLGSPPTRRARLAGPNEVCLHHMSATRSEPMNSHARRIAQARTSRVVHRLSV